MYIANPIYDIVFKYLMEDERIARTILSALLQKDVVAVETRANEYDNISRDSLSIFRIDFGATIREADGSEHLILIELQKTWVPTETLRFRQYLGAQYANKMNMHRVDGRDYGLPMVTVYLLGHKVGDIEEPVLYVRRRPEDYNGREVTKGLPDPFVDSLTHDSIIVQIPRLHGQVNNRLEKVLSVFDQTYKDGDGHVLKLDDSYYEDDSEMQPIVRRLLSAASDADMRHKMNVEDEYFSTIEEQDTAIMQQRKEIAEHKAHLKEQKAKLEKQKVKLEEQSAQLEEQSAQLEEQSAQLEEQSAQLEEKSAQLEEQKAQLTEKDAQITEQKALLRTSVKLLLEAGMTTEEIADRLNLDIDTILQVS